MIRPMGLSQHDVCECVSGYTWQYFRPPISTALAVRQTLRVVSDCRRLITE